MADLIKTLDALESPFMALLVVKTENYRSAGLSLINLFSNKHLKKGIYVTVNKPYEEMVSFLDKNKMPSNSLFFIDMISKESKTESNRENCFFIASPTALTDLGIALEEIVSSISGSKYLILDTLSTLLVYNQANTVERFVHFLSNKIRLWKMDGVIVSLQAETSENLKAQLAQFCDAVIET